MDLDLTSNQELFLETSTRFMDATYPLSAVREHAPEADPGPEYRRQAFDDLKLMRREYDRIRGQAPAGA